MWSVSLLTLKSSGRSPSSLVRGTPLKRRSWSAAELGSAWYEGGGCVYCSGSSCGAGVYFAVLAIVSIDSLELESAGCSG